MTNVRVNALQGIANLLPKLDDPDPDIRFMQLNDLASILNNAGSDSLRNDTHAAARVIDRLIKALTDSNGEVQNQALKCAGPLALRTPNDYIAPYLDKITELTAQDIDISVPITALRIIVGSLPRPGPSASERDVKEAFSAISKVLIPRLIGYVPSAAERKIPEISPALLQQQKGKSYSADAVDVVIEIMRCYGTLLRNEELTALGNALLDIIGDEKANGVVKKRALAGMSSIVLFYKPAQLTDLVNFVAKQLQSSNLSTNHRRYLVATIGALTRSIPSRVGSQLPALAPLVLAVLSQDELDAAREDSDDAMETDVELEELREATLVTLDLLLALCPTEMLPYLGETIQAALRYLKYDPNIVDQEEDEEMSGTQSDDGFTEDPIDDDDEYAELDDDDAFGDIEDLSWKVRRCAAKLILTVISTIPSTDHDTLFAKIAPALLSRLNNEREDSVRLEIISAITALVQKSALASTSQSAEEQNDSVSPSATATSHKRKRQDSNVSVQDADLKGLIRRRTSLPIAPASPPLHAQANVALLVPRIVQATVKIWKKASLALKQSAVLMLKAIAQSRNGALADHLQQLEDPLADALKSSGGSGSTSASSSTATIASLRIETLSLISTISKTHPSAILMPFIIALIPPVTDLVSDKNYKVSTETLITIEQFAKALSPPRLPAANQDHAIHIEKLYSVTLGPVNDVSADLEVRHRAIHVFGILMSRTSGTTLLSPEARTKALGILDDRLKNETTRLESARAIGLVAEAATQGDVIGNAWVQEVSIELANQLRKADRSLRASCLEALQYLAVNPVTAALYDSDAIATIQTQLMTVINTDDLHLLTPALVIMAKIIPTNPDVLVNAPIVEALCKIAQTRLEGLPLRAYLYIVRVIGEQGLGHSLMTGLLAVGTNGDTHVLGRAVGTLMVFGGTKLGVSLDSFIGEVHNKDEDSACLALAVLGEVGARTLSETPFDMNIFVQSLSAKSDKVRLAAAVALGSTSTSNIPKYLPGILQGLDTGSEQEYLYIHSLKEILHTAENTDANLMPYLNEIWTKLFAVAALEDNQAVGSECIGRVVLLDPSKSLQALSQALDATSVQQRGVVISAFRFTLSDVSNTYNAVLARYMVSLLKKMLSDPDLGNRRLAVTTLTAAIQHKSDLVLPDLAQILPVVLSDTHIKKELIKTVKIGPFTHHEDSGLDLRKSAYSTLYTLVETPRALSSLSSPSIFDRIQDGFTDDHDIRTLCALMLSRLSDLDPEEAKRRLSPLAEQFKKVLDQKPKENAVKQEIEKINEANATVIRSSLDLSKKFRSAATSGDADMVGWKNYLEYMHKEYVNMVKSITNDAA